ncbi:murein hydrolase activator EnvC family protein [Aureimonas mangrovi]|uniref:murein hydrolase activator EnvC family protein n=1 Tax=Aureimonas mangrovi TaxID=2758041 RepID=UPI00163D46C8|nr:peptidoglycan DD-metalloendopeptidase family protein [Aureimonas mangrovi]
MRRFDGRERPSCVQRDAQRSGCAIARALSFAAALFCTPLPVAHAETGEPSGDAPLALADIIGEAERIAAAREKTRDELLELGSRITLTQETAERLDAEIAAIAQDRDAIREAMIEAAEAQKNASTELAAVESELDELATREGEVQESLRRRRGTLSQVLGALQRMGRKPAPAILVHPDDALGSVRSAILLGSVVPRIREEADALALDLAELAQLREGIETRKLAFADGLARQREEEARLQRLFAEKERLEADSREALAAMNRRAAELAGEANSLQDLIGALETDLAQAQAAEEQARELAARQAAEAEARRLAALEEARERAAAALEAEAQAAAEAEASRLAALEPPEPERPQYDIASLRRDMAQLDVSAPFSTMKGTLTRPVVGAVRRAFGDDDGFGRRTEGTTFQSRAGDIVTAPADGRILYSGPFRSYGQLLILNAGDGYHIVLAGMREIDVDVGQFVLAGEPVAVMGSRRLASAGAQDLPGTEPSLYVEFRKDGKPVDPAPWWADGPSGRTGNDS